jgi:hypothetical protein
MNKIKGQCGLDRSQEHTHKARPEDNVLILINPTPRVDTKIAPKDFWPGRVW